MSSYRPLSQDANQPFPSTAIERDDDARSVASSASSFEEELSANDPQYPSAPPPPPLHQTFDSQSPTHDRASIGSRDSGFDRVIDMVKGLGTRSRAGSTKSYERVAVDGLPSRSRKNSKASGQGEGFMSSLQRQHYPTSLTEEKEHISSREITASPLSVGGGPSNDRPSHARAEQLGLQLDGGQDQHRENVSDATSATHNHHAVERHTSPLSNNNAAALGQRHQLHVETDEDLAAGQRPLPNILDPNDPTFDFPHSPEGVHPALRYANQSPSGTPPPPHHSEPQHEPVHGPVATSYSHTGGDFFEDFDGVHCSPEEPAGSPQFPPTAPALAERRSSQQLSNLQHPQPQSFENPSPSENPNLRYYPAPVPAVLKLPPRMAKSKPQNGRLTKVNKRASKPMLTDKLYTDEQNDDDRRQSTNLDEPRSNTPGPIRGTTPGPQDLSRRRSGHFDERPLANLPPALRASQFFENRAASTPPPAAPQVVESSAMATLDSILDASARAPAAAFTDHPITGGSSTSHMRNQSTGFGGYRNSVAMTVKLHPGESPRSSMDNGERELEHLNPSNDPRESHSFEGTGTGTGTGPESTGPPTTLLAELESRKAQQKSRTRTAASAFPGGMHSTLLQLDAVSQVQAQSRRTKRIHLAWEDPEQDIDEGEDEDVPLGLLYQGQNVARKRDDDVPLGLLMRKELEDSEPLAARRARLRTEVGIPAEAPKKDFLHIPLPGGEPEDEDEEETLAQRIKRLKEQKARPQTSPEAKRMSTFGDGALEINFNPPTSQAAVAAPAPVAPEEETLGQRRRRLQEEANRVKLSEEAKVVQAEVRKRQSMATILQGQNNMGYMGQPPLVAPNTRPGSFYPGPQHQALYNQQQSMMMMQPVNGGLIHNAGPQSMLRPQMSMGNIGMSGAANGYGGGGPQGYGSVSMAHFQQQEHAMNQKQREFVERWRASVM